MRSSGHWRYGGVALVAANAAGAVALVWLAAEVSVVAAAAIAAALLAAQLLVVRRFPAAVLSDQRTLALLERMAEARRSAFRDQSTGLVSRWYLEQRLEEEASRCRRYGYSMSLIVLRAARLNLADISTDAWQEESAVAARRCAEAIRSFDLCAVLAPLEFAICLIQCERADAAAAAARLAQQLPSYDCAIGIAVYPGDSEDGRGLIGAARERCRAPVQGDMSPTA